MRRQRQQGSTERTPVPAIDGSGLPRLRPVRIDAGLFDQMVRHLQATAPVEGCGLVAFDDDRPVKVYPGTNTLNSMTRYRMDDREVLRAVDEMERKGWWLGAIYHSHPNSPPVPSSTDLREANWPDALMIIISLEHDQPLARAYRVEHDGYKEAPLVIDSPKPGILPNMRELVRFAKSAMTEQPSVQEHHRPLGQAAAGGSLRTAPLAPDLERAVVADPPPRATIGILGGMGPMATVDLMAKIIQATPASRDQEHIPVVVVSDPRVPDRTSALLENGDDPVPWLIRGGQQLIDAGADFIVIPCNTAHAFLNQVQPQLERPIISMIDAASDAIHRDYPDAASVGLLATSGTIQSGIYQGALGRFGINTIIPDLPTQTGLVMEAIRTVKAGNSSQAARDLLVDASRELMEDGAQVLLAACTEIPVVLRARHVPVPLVDATDELAKLAVSLAREIDAGVERERANL